MTAINASFIIVPFESRHRDAFRTLNLAWLVGNDLYERADDKQLDDPEGIVANGGEIYIAKFDSQVVGTAALIPLDAHEVELAKVSVDSEAQGRGIGRALTTHCIERARARGFHSVVLTTSSKLVAAIRLYESLGFEHMPIPEWSAYATADVAMVLRLHTAVK